MRIQSFVRLMSVLILTLLLTGCFLFGKEPVSRPPPEVIRIPIPVDVPEPPMITVPELAIDSLSEADRGDYRKIVRSYRLSLESLDKELRKAIRALDVYRPKQREPHDQ